MRRFAPAGCINDAVARARNGKPEICRMEAVTIVGAGGIGCAVGYALRSVGLSVTLVDADPIKIAWGREHGVAVDLRSPLSADFQHFADWSARPNGVIVLCTKCY